MSINFIEFTRKFINQVYLRSNLRNFVFFLFHAFEWIKCIMCLWICIKKRERENQHNEIKTVRECEWDKVKIETKQKIKIKTQTCIQVVVELTYQNLNRHIRNYWFRNTEHTQLSAAAKPKKNQQRLSQPASNNKRRNSTTREKSNFIFSSFRSNSTDRIPLQLYTHVYIESTVKSNNTKRKDEIQSNYCCFVAD